MADSKNTPPAGRGGKSTTGRPSRADGGFPKMPADHPLYKAGFVIGQRRPRTRAEELFKPASPDDPIYKAGWLIGQRRAADYATRPAPQETAAQREGRLESEAFAKHRERQRRPRPANPGKP